MVESVDRTVRALEYRQAGATYATIGKALGISESAAFEAVKRGLARLKKDCDERADELRSMEGQRLDRMFAAVWPQVLAGNHGAVDKALKIMDRRAKLYGLDAPTAFIAIPPQQGADEIARIRRRYADLAGVSEAELIGPDECHESDEEGAGSDSALGDGERDAEPATGDPDGHTDGEGE